jgi:acetylcholinesterase/cholinesterase
MKNLIKASSVLILASLVAISCANSIIVNTPYGPIQGVATEVARSFKGIPYAEPPVGSLRWATTVPKKPWAPNTLQALNYGHGCPQRCELPPLTCPDTQSEDCLTLNIWTPVEMDPSKLAPVMVFLPGGRFEQGASGSVLYDGSLISNRSGVIMVTSNYRLGVLGWLATTNGLEGNFGLEDQRTALRFLQKILPSFGGDPNLITLFGQSAGATSTATHLTSPRSKDLFQRAIIQSGPLSLPNKPKADADWLGDQFAKMIGCAPSDIACFRSAPVDLIVDMQKEADHIANIAKPLESGMPWVPVIDTSKDDVLGQPLALLASGQFHKMPVIIGSVWQDCLPFIYMGFKGYMSDLEYSVVLLAVFPQIFQEVMAKYPPSPIFGDKRPWLAVLGTDYIFDCPSRFAVQNMANTLQGTGNHVYLYNFNQSLSYDGWGPNYTFCQGKVCHGVELPYLFDSARGAGFHTTEDEETLSRYFGAYWTNFARTGDPNQGSQPNQALYWPPYDSVSRPSIEMAAPNAYILNNFRNEHCSWWDQKGYNWGWGNNAFLGRPQSVPGLKLIGSA